MAFRPDVIEKALAHGDGYKVRSVYNRAKYLTERREMMQKYVDFLDELANNTQKNILLKKAV